MADPFISYYPSRHHDKWTVLTPQAFAHTTSSQNHNGSSGHVPGRRISSQLTQQDDEVPFSGLSDLVNVTLRL